jgi:hypothetical protein
MSKCQYTTALRRRSYLSGKGELKTEQRIVGKIDLLVKFCWYREPLVPHGVHAGNVTRTSCKSGLHVKNSIFRPSPRQLSRHSLHACTHACQSAHASTNRRHNRPGRRAAFPGRPQRGEAGRGMQLVALRSGVRAALSSRQASQFPNSTFELASLRRPWSAGVGTVGRQRQRDVCRCHNEAATAAPGCSLAGSAGQPAPQSLFQSPPLMARVV